MRTLKNLLSVLVVGILFLPKAQANVLFEGWFEVYKGTKKIGFVVEKYEFSDSKFKATYYLKTNADGNNVTESVKAFAKSDLTPLSYAYTSKVGDSVKVIDAQFKGENESLEIFDGKQKTKSTKKIKKGTFLSQFLMYLILQQPDGLTAGKDYSYFAIAEEDGVTYKGDAFVKAEEPVKGKKAFKILNEFKGEKFFTWVTGKGEPLLTRSPESNIEVRFADSQEIATKDMMVKLQDIKLLFGSIPGEGGSLSEKADTNLKSGEEKPPAKGSGKSKTAKSRDSDKSGTSSDGSGGSDPNNSATTSSGDNATSDGGGNTASPRAPPNAPAPQAPKSSAQDPGNGVEIKGVKPPSN